MCWCLWAVSQTSQFESFPIRPGLLAPRVGTQGGMAACGAAWKGTEYPRWTTSWKLIAPQGPLQGTSWRHLLPPHLIALWGHSTAPMPRSALAQLLLPWGTLGTAPLFPRRPQHRYLCPWVSTGKGPCVLGESWQSILCPTEPWHSSLCPGEKWNSSLCPWLSTGTAPSAPGGVLAQLPLPWGGHWHNFFCPKRALTQLPFPSGGGPGTVCCALGGVLAQLPLPHGALAQLYPQQGSTSTDPSA